MYLTEQKSKNNPKKRGDTMAKFFTDNSELRSEFDKLPAAVKNAIIEAGVEISSVEQLKKAARSIEENM